MSIYSHRGRLLFIHFYLGRKIVTFIYQNYTNGKQRSDIFFKFFSITHLNPNSKQNKLNMKAWDLTRYSSHASRPSHCPAQLNEQHRSPRRYGYTTPLLILDILQQQYTILVKGDAQINTSRGHLPLLCSLTVYEVCEVSKRQEQSVK